MRKITAFAAAAVAMLVSTSAFAGWDMDNLRSKYNLPPRFDAAMVRANAADEAVASIRKYYRVGAGFTAEDIIRSVGERAVQDMRRNYSVGPNFTCKELRRALGARSLAERMENLKLSPGFTHDDYVMALGRDEARHNYSGNMALESGELPANSDEFGRKKAESRMQEKLKYNKGLPEHFNYQQYREIAGPTEAGYFRAEYGFTKTATYDEMLKAMAEKIKSDFARDSKISVDWKLEDVLKTLGEKRLRWQLEDLKITGPITEASLAEAYGARDAQWTIGKFADSEDCTEADIARNRGEQSVRNLRAEYDLDDNFTEAQVRQAASENAIASVRRNFGVTGNFNSEDLEKADQRLSEERAEASKKWKKCLAETVDYDMYSRCVQP